MYSAEVYSATSGNNCMIFSGSMIGYNELEGMWKEIAVA
jgi:hypothetical protein